MSLTFEGFIEAINRYDAIEERVTGLLGFSPLYSDHYGSVILYGVRIERRTTDEEILAIRNQYIKWRDDITKLLEECGLEFSEDYFGISIHFGTFTFLGESIDIYESVEKFVPIVVEYAKNQGKGIKAIFTKQMI